KKRKSKRRWLWSICWDSGWPGGGGDVEEGQQVGRRYYCESGDDGRVGPDWSLRRGIREREMTLGNEAVVSIGAACLSAEEIVGMLQTDGLEPGHVLLINDEEWEYVKPGRWRRLGPVEDEDEDE